MSYRIETLSGAKESEFGFWSADVSRVRFGELEAMSLAQFCDYATNAVIISFDSVSQKERVEIKKVFSDAIEFTCSLPEIEEKPLDMPRLRQMTQTGKAILESPYGEIELNQYKRGQDWDMEMREALEADDKNRISRLTQEMIIATNIARGATIGDYQENPFAVDARHIDIMGKYQVSFVEFAYFTSYILRGGIIGWSDEGIPKKVRESLVKIQVSILEPAINGAQ